MKNYLFGLFSGFVILGSIIAPLIWPPELSLIFNSLFWASTLLLILTIIMLIYLYKNGASSEKVLFVFSLMFIIGSAQMYSGFEELASNIGHWKPYFENTYPRLFILLPMFIEYTKNIIAFGIAAIGAGICAGIIIHRFYSDA